MSISSGTSSPRYLGVDYGDARTGIAVSDGIFARGVETIHSSGMRKTANRVAEVAKKQGADIIVLGCPYNMDGSVGARAEKAMAFADILREATGLTVVLQDERLTTVEAYDIMDTTDVRGRRRRGNVDTLSAEIILQEYIDSARNKSE